MLAIDGDAFLRIADLRFRGAADQDRVGLVAETLFAFERTVEMLNGDGHGNADRLTARASR